MDEGLGSKARKALRSYLEYQPGWDAFFTVTFRTHQKFPFTAIDKTVKALSQNTIGRLFVAAEQHYLGGYHTHGLVSFRPIIDGSSGEYDLQMAIAKSRFNRLGWSDISHPRNVGGVTGYCGKYITKECAEWMIYGQEWLPLDNNGIMSHGNL